MKLRNLLGLAAGTAGLTAVANRLVRRRGEAFEPLLPGTERRYRWRGFDVSYVEAGDPADRDLVLCHGISIAASNHEFHAVVERLAEEYHVLAPDLPGFGHTDRPPLVYSAPLLTNFVTDFLGEEAEEPVVVGSSLTGAYVASAAAEVPVERAILVTPTDDTLGDRRAWLRTLLRTPVLGQAIHYALASRYSLRHFHEDHGYYDPANLTGEVLAYEWATAHQPGARFAPASFLTGFLDPEEALEDSIADVDAPVTLVWGRNADVSPVSEGRALAESTGSTLLVFDRTKLLPHVEHPGTFVDVVTGEFDATEAA